MIKMKKQKNWKKFWLKAIDDISVYFVDGNYVRNNIFVDFVEGGHGYVYGFIPKDEIWIEELLDREDEKHNLLHEMYELTLMKYVKMSYDKAHDKAALFEAVIRKVDISKNHEKIILDILKKC
jgi:hypothetical protein